MKERPILMSAPMVRALLEGRKTQTRRIMNPQPVHAQHHVWKGKTVRDAEHRMWCWKDVVLENIWDFPNGDDRRELALHSPYGLSGDRLWVREAWKTGSSLDKCDAKAIAALCLKAGYKTPGAPVLYLANDYVRRWGDNDRSDFGVFGRYRHARFMPRWASRLTLGIAEIRVQRLRDIGVKDAIAEGCEPLPPFPASVSAPEDYISGYRNLWESINGAGSWDSNPWVWAVTFEVAV